ncbi:MAG TPA: twin-arginine translocation signal domain-containing protein [Pyrinomonadaceae bacterium]|nr:twin-arginine translocation signal domain-containing protein [Pyrinomonadaceae bacterium]
MDDLTRSEAKTSKVSRRKFVKGAATVATAAAIVPLKPLLSGKESVADAANGNSNSSNRMNACFNYRKNRALAQRINVGPQADNGDISKFTDFSGSFSKALLHDSLGVPNAAAFLSLKNAISTGNFSDFANIGVGTPGGDGNSKLNGPQAALAFDLEGLDSHATVIPSAPSVASAQTAAEQVEHYWAALLADVPFTDYATNALVGDAVTDMNAMSFLSSAGNNQFPYPVTRQNLFRGQFVPGDGNVQGPYVSQFMVQPTFYGSQLLSQQHQTFLPEGAGGSNFMTSEAEYQLVQNGGNSGRSLAFDPTFRYHRDGRDLAAYTHVDVLYQGYFVAFLVLAGIGAPPNPGNPYIGSQTQKGFGTLGGPDAAATIAEMATRALKASWYHKWIKDLRMRPEEYGALVHARKTGSSAPQAAAALHGDVVNSAVLPIINANYGSYLLPQPFPEGAPTHPCYPTGHGTVGGACITALKFFFDGGQKIRPLLTSAGRDVYEPSTDGLSLNTYTGPDRNNLDINGELNKLAYNVSFGHGIHAGIHFRSSTYWSILLGEQVALSVLQDRAGSYNEPFTINITKFDGTTATITNQ